MEDDDENKGYGNEEDDEADLIDMDNLDEDQKRQLEQYLRYQHQMAAAGGAH